MVVGVLRFLLGLTGFSMVTAWIPLCVLNNPPPVFFRIAAACLLLFTFLTLVLSFDS